MSIDHTAQDKPVVAGAVITLLSSASALRQAYRKTETTGLIEALGSQTAFVESFSIRKPNPARLFGQGQIDQIADWIDQHGCELLIVDGELSPIQQRNLERALNIKVIDRTGLILEIFGLRAKSKAGRLQVETARLAYERSRLVRTWTHLERQRGGQGVMSGPGETQIEADRWMIDDKVQRLKSQLRDVERTRRVQRSGRAARDVPIVSLVGYTNAGKSTLFNRLTDADVFAQNMPFATLDPTIRYFDVGIGGEVALVDTVGFITDLPTTLIEAFKATLEEAVLSDLILHVHDSASDEVFDQAAEVERILDDLEELVDEDLPPIIHVWNKVDLLSDDELAALEHGQKEQDAAFVSATTGKGIPDLVQRIKSGLTRNTRLFDIRLESSLGQARSWLYAHGDVMSEEDTESGSEVVVKVRLDRKALGQFQQFFNDKHITIIKSSG